MIDGYMMGSTDPWSQLYTNTIFNNILSVLSKYDKTNKVCIKCGTARRRWIDEDRLAPDGFCWSCKE